MEKAVNRKTEAISVLMNQYQNLVNANRAKVGESPRDDSYFKLIEEELEKRKDNFEDLKLLYFNLGVTFWRNVIEYDLSHDNINEDIINIFLKEKLFSYLLQEKIDDEVIDNKDDNTPEIDNKKKEND